MDRIIEWTIGIGEWLTGHPEVNKPGPCPWLGVRVNDWVWRTFLRDDVSGN